MARETLEGRWNEFALLALLLFAIAMVAQAPSIAGAFGGMEWLNGMSSGLSTVLSVLVITPLEYALFNLFLSLVRREEMPEGSMREWFNEFSRNWQTYVIAGVLMAIIVVLIGVVTLFIGAVIFSLAYGMVPFIIRDNPGIGAKEALYQSRMMMRGHKAELFLLELSFIGWALLCCICWIGFLWLLPYMYVAMAHFYEDVKAEYEPVHPDVAA